MEDLLTLLFVLFFFVAPLLEGLLKRRRKGGEGEMPEPEPRATRRERPTRREPPRPVERAERGAGTAGAGRRPSTSEGMIPREIWEEISGLSTGTGGPSGGGEARRAPPGEPGGPEVGEGEIEPRVSAEDRGREAVSERAPVAPGATVRSGEISGPVRARTADPVPHLKKLPGRGGEGAASGLLEELRGPGAREELRRAVLYREILGPPVTLRDG